MILKTTMVIALGQNLCVSHLVMSDSLWPHTVACQAPLFMEFSRQEYWSGFPFLLRGDLPDTGIKPVSPVTPALAGRFLTTEPPMDTIKRTNM